MTKLRTIIALMFLCAGMTWAQEETVLWSDEYQDRGYYSIIGESEDALFVERKYNTRLNDRDVDMEILRFDGNLELTHTIRLKDIERTSYESIMTLNTPEGLAHFYYQTTKRGEQYVSAQLFSHEDLSKIEIVDIAKFKILKSARSRINQDRDFQFDFPLDIISSRDKSKIAIMFDQERAGKGKKYYHQYCVVDISNGFNILHQGDFYSDKSSNKYRIVDRHLSDTGKLSYAIKKFYEDNNTEHINKQPGYDYEIHHMSGDSMEYIYDIDIKKEFMDRLTLGSDDEENLYIAGFFRKKPFGDITHSYLMSLDPLGYERYTAKEKYGKRRVKRIMGKEDDKLNKNFVTVDILPANDIVYIVRQYRFRGSRNANFDGAGFRSRGFNQVNNLVYHWDYDEVLVEGIGKNTGEELWSVVNPREQEDNDAYSRYFITGQYEVFNNDLICIYNEREENLIRVRRNENLKRADIPGDRTAIAIAKVSSGGDIKYNLFEEENYFHLPENGTLIGNQSLYLFNHHKGYKKFFLGKLPLEILNF